MVERLIQIPQRPIVIGSNAIKADALPDMEPSLQAQIIDIAKHRKPFTLAREARAFKHEFYQTANEKQIREDVELYLAEYRLEVSEIDYRLGIVEGRLIDSASGESMVEKARKAVKERQKDGLNSSREGAETEGLVSLESQLKENPNGTVIWFSPPGSREEGYGDYGFGYVGKVNGDTLEMTAIRLEFPQIADFNEATGALWGEGSFKVAEDFLRSPKVIDIDSVRVSEFIHGNFEIKDEESKKIFEKVRQNLGGAIAEYSIVVREGTEREKHQAFHVIENLSLELKSKYELEMRTGNVVFIKDYEIPTLAAALKMEKYTSAPPVVRGSCGSTANQESNDIFRNINKSKFKSRDWEFNEAGPCQVCGKDVPCGPCKVCESCNDNIDAQKLAA